MTTQRSTRRSRARRTLIAALPLVAFTTVLWVKPMGLLLWARLRILTNIPRTAVAEPEPPKAPRTKKCHIKSLTILLLNFSLKVIKEYNSKTF